MNPLLDLEMRRLMDEAQDPRQWDFSPRGEARPYTGLPLSLVHEEPMTGIRAGDILPGTGEALAMRDIGELEALKGYLQPSLMQDESVMDAFSRNLERAKLTAAQGAIGGLTALGMVPILGAVTDPAARMLSRGARRSASEQIFGATHFSPERRTSLDPAQWGTGAQGQDIGRRRSMAEMGLEAPERTYFYPPMTEEALRPEPGVGRELHTADLKNIYNPNVAPPRVTEHIKNRAAEIAEEAGWGRDPSVRKTAWEIAVKEAGFGGYRDPNTGWIANFGPTEVEYVGRMQPGVRSYDVLQGPPTQSGSFTGPVSPPATDVVPTSVMNKRSQANRNQIQAVEDSVASARMQYPQVQGWKPFTPNFNVNKEGKLEWKPDAASGFDYHLDPVTRRPLEGAQRAGQIDRMADVMVSDVEDVMNRMAAGDSRAAQIMEGLSWYRRVRERVRDHFGAAGNLYGDLQAATSPNTGLAENFAMADEAFKRFLEGDFDSAIGALERHIADGGTVANFPAKQHIKKRNQKLFGYHTDRVLASMLDQFRQVRPGMPPKVRNYGANWTGSSLEPTIDLWAGRTAQRAAGRPRAIPAANKVTGEWRPVTGTMVEAKRRAAAGEPVEMYKGGAYGMASDAMTEAVSRLKAKYPGRFDDINPDDFQAFEWLYEKDLWEGQGWTRAEREANAIEMMDQDPRQLYRSAISATQETPPTFAAQAQMKAGLEQGLDQPGILPTTESTWGVYAGDPELSVAQEVSAPSGWNPRPLVENVAREAEAANQIDAMVSRRAELDDPNARPGFEAYFEPEQAQRLVPQIEDIMGRHGILGYTEMQGPRREVPSPGVMGPPREVRPPVGIQSMYSPEISIRYGEELAPGINVQSVMNNPELVNLLSKAERKKYRKIVEEIKQLEGVQFAKQYEYDTLHFGQGMSGPGTYGQAMTPEVGPPRPEATFGALSAPERLRRGILGR